MRRLERLRRNMQWSNPFAESEIYYWSLTFFKSQAEAGFAAALSRRLARHMGLVGFVIMALETVWIAVQSWSLGPASDGDPELRRAKLERLAVHALIGLVGLAIGTAGCAQSRRSVLTPRLFEIVIVACLMLILCAIPFAFDVSNECSGLILLIDCTVTVASLMPLRWKVLWVLHLLAILLYPALHFMVVGGMVSTGRYAPLLLLIISAAMGKRDVEVQERRFFCTVAAERTLRASSEFMLMQSKSTQERLGAPASVTAASLDTGEVFELEGDDDEAADTATLLGRVKTVAEREQWLIRNEDVSLRASEVIGSGGFGAVVMASWCGTPAAVKLSLEPVGHEAAKGLASLVSELRVLRKVRHPNIVLFLGAVIHPTLCEVAMVLELVSGPNLIGFISEASWGAGPLPDISLYRLSSDMLRALRYLHRHKPAIVHGDLKPSNILLEHPRSSEPRLKLVDFGLSRILSGRVRKLGGTLLWMAPELHQGNASPSTAVDVYAVGRIMTYMITRTKPFRGMARAEIQEALVQGDIPGIDLQADSSPTYSEVWNIAMECISAEASDRPSASAICSQLQAVGEHHDFRDLLGDCARELWGTSELGGSDGGDEGGLGRAETLDLAIPKLRKAMLQQQAAGAGAPAPWGDTKGRLPTIDEVLPGKELRQAL